MADDLCVNSQETKHYQSLSLKNLQIDVVKIEHSVLDRVGLCLNYIYKLYSNVIIVTFVDTIS